jgi:hypothetical protein
LPEPLPFLTIRLHDELMPGTGPSPRQTVEVLKDGQPVGQLAVSAAGYEMNIQSLGQLTFSVLTERAEVVSESFHSTVHPVAEKCAGILQGPDDA